MDRPSGSDGADTPGIEKPAANRLIPSGSGMHHSARHQIGIAVKIPSNDDRLEVVV